ncbi:MAG: N-acetylmuramoyl-L-alanine amidase [Candidatus Eisenbacteria bacterium]|nr:N-acetylmuramoyl-L-alanine amidase [Candidatus Eisenbacteria bacterium]
MILLFASAAAAENLVVRHADGRTSDLVLETREEGSYLRASDVSLLLGASLDRRTDLLKMTIRLGDHRVKVTAENPNIVVDGAVVRLLSPVLFRDGDFLLPLELVGDLLAGLAPFPARWESASGVLHIGSVGRRILGVRLEEHPGRADATILTAGRPDFEEERGGIGTIVIRFPSLEIADDSLPPPGDESLIAGWVWEVRADSVFLRVLPGAACLEHRVERRVRPEGVRIRLSAAPIGDLGDAVSAAVEVLTRPKGERTSGESVVVVDPGHGGSDAGGLLPGGLPEKTLALDLALRLRRALEGIGGMRVVLTREEDIDLSIRSRAESANRARGDLFVSLHVNGSLAERRSGPETYVHALARSGEERIRKAIAEAASLYGETPLGGALTEEIRLVPWEAVQQLHGARSREAARGIEEELRGAGGIDSARAREAPVAVLVGVDMPAVLVEVGFATHLEEGALLASDEERARLAASLARAIARFLRGES